MGSGDDQSDIFSYGGSCFNPGSLSVTVQQILDNNLRIKRCPMPGQADFRLNEPDLICE